MAQSYADSTLFCGGQEGEGGGGEAGKVALVLNKKKTT